jgi:hypothetical protein
MGGNNVFAVTGKHLLPKVFTKRMYLTVGASSSVFHLLSRMHRNHSGRVGPAGIP